MSTARLGCRGPKLGVFIRPPAIHDTVGGNPASVIRTNTHRPEPKPAGNECGNGTDIALTGRVDVLLSGDWKQYKDFTSWPGEELFAYVVEFFAVGLVVKVAFPEHLFDDLHAAATATVPHRRRSLSIGVWDRLRRRLQRDSCPHPSRR